MKRGQKHEPVSKTRSRARERALKKESSATASTKAPSEQTRSAIEKRYAADRSKAAQKAVKTEGPEELSAAGKKAAHTRAHKNPEKD